MYISTATKAKELRDWYKSNLGLTRNDVSVRKEHEGCLRIEIRNPNLKVATKDKIYYKAKGYEDIRRDGYGEILSGGNDFVFIYDMGKTYWPSDRK